MYTPISAVIIICSDMPIIFEMVTIFNVPFYVSKQGGYLSG